MGSPWPLSACAHEGNESCHCSFESIAAPFWGGQANLQHIVVSLLKPVSGRSLEAACKSIRPRRTWVAMVCVGNPVFKILVGRLSVVFERGLI